MASKDYEPIQVGDIVERWDFPSGRCRVLHIYPDGLASFEVIKKDGTRDRRWSNSGGFTGSLRYWRRVDSPHLTPTGTVPRGE